MNWQASPETDEDLIAARDFIAVDNESAARDFLDAAFEAFDRLAHFPEMGRGVPEFHRPELREVIHRSYRVIYRVKREVEAVEIVRFWHGARGFPHLPTALSRD